MTMIVARLNARLRPFDRGELFEDPLAEVLREQGIGEVTGGGSQLSHAGEIEWCDIEIEASDGSTKTISVILAELESRGAPKGSGLTVDDAPEVAFGVAEGLAVYLNGTDLPAQVYRDYGFDAVREEFDRRLEGEGLVFSYWEGPSETALYVYGRSFAGMYARLSGFLAEHPLCQKCRVVQTA